VLIIQIHFNKSFKSFPREPVLSFCFEKQIKVRGVNHNFAAAGTRLKNKTILPAFPENSQN